MSVIIFSVPFVVALTFAMLTLFKEMR